MQGPQPGERSVGEQAEVIAWPRGTSAVLASSPADPNRDPLAQRLLADFEDSLGRQQVLWHLARAILDAVCAGSTSLSGVERGARGYLSSSPVASNAAAAPFADVRAAGWTAESLPDASQQLFTAFAGVLSLRRIVDVLRQCAWELSALPAEEIPSRALGMAFVRLRDGEPQRRD